MKTEQIHLFISGKVQGVGFRYATQAEARKLGLTGWVRNLPDSRVEIVAQGEPESIESLLGWCEIGPANAEVQRIDVAARAELASSPLADFEIRH